MTIHGRLGVGAILAAICLMAGTGCSYTKTDDERMSLQADNARLTQQLAADQAALQRAAAERAALQRQLAAKPVVSNPVTDENGVTTGNKNAKGEDLIQIADDVLFDSGQDKLKPTAVKALEKVADILQSQYAGQTIRIEGHTDDVRVRANSVWQDNWDLGANRSRQVLLYLEKKGLPRDKMYLASFADTQPRDPTDLAKNRRVEIVVVK
jgi:flagellar motor protein MotB